MSSHCCGVEVRREELPAQVSSTSLDHGSKLRDSEKPHRGCGSPVVKISVHGRHVTSAEASTTKDPPCRAAMHVNLSRVEMSFRWCGMIVRRGVLAQVSSSSLDHGSKLRGPSPKAPV
ncbi:hypothetical protein TNCV_3632841 [Trichonephila clavipes]|nr:hypothetical protein TNCV_3632841 [Trichonephila clavipes]